MKGGDAMNIKEYLLDLYEVELHKRCIYSDSSDFSKSKVGKEEEYVLTQKHIRILEHLLDSLE